MRRLALALVLLPSLAWGKGMVIVDDTYSPTAGVVKNLALHANYARAVTQQLLDRFGISYVIVPPKIARTEFCRIGVQTWNQGAANAYTESFDWVLHVDFDGKLTTLNPNYRPDSLTLSALSSQVGGMLVPQLFWLLQRNSAVPSPFASDSTTDTTGFGSASPPGFINEANAIQVPVYMKSSSGRIFLESSYIASVFTHGTPLRKAGGVPPWLIAGLSARLLTTTT